ncbi:MAG: hypothetical protein IJ438_14510 [Clostridia bacterium]|nr:hypothetical protein [Clostridia bacterium]
MSAPRPQRRSTRRDEPAWSQDEFGFYEEEVSRRMPAQPEVIATNAGVRLACTMAGMIGLLAVFFCFVEKESRAIRRFSVQSAALTATHVLLSAVLLLVGSMLGTVPYLGFLVNLICWLMYFAMLVILLVVRVKLMEAAWHGHRFDMPVLEALLERYY